jgi:glycosidase
VHEFLREMNREVLSKHDILTVGELSQTSVDQMIRFVHPERRELQMGFCFDHVNLGRGGIDNAMVEPHTLPQFTAILSRWQALREMGGWHALYLENHDQVSAKLCSC